MAISVTCTNCGKTLTVADSLAGRKGKCPSCKTVLVVPGIEDAVDAPEQVQEAAAPESSACPNCSRELSPGDVFCVECGTNIETGEQIKGV